MTLAEFLLARIAEDEVKAQANREAYEEFPTRLAVWPPARVLAECDAKRRIVDYWGPFETLEGDKLLKVLALPYADHPDYRQEWRP